MLTVRDLLRDLDVRLRRGEAWPAPAGALGAHLRAARPDAVAVRWRAAADHRACSSTPPSGSASSSARLADHHLAGARVRDRLRARDGARGGARGRRPSASSRCSRSPTRCRSSRSPRRRSRQLVNEQYAVAAPRSGGAGAAGADRPVRARARCPGRRAGHADRRGRARVRRAAASRSCSTPSAGAVEPDDCSASLQGEMRERARRREARAFMPSLADGRPGRWRCRSPPTARRDSGRLGRPRPGARGVAGGDQGQRRRCRTSTG